jgi:uncharacterized protein (TIGR03435 family)
MTRRSAQLWILVATVLAPLTIGQVIPRSLSVQGFKSVSVRPSAAPTDRSEIHSDSGILRARSVSIRDLILWAYDTEYLEFSVESARVDDRENRYDVEARMTFPASAPVLREQLRKLLSDSFSVQVHQERRDAFVYSLLAGDNGVKLRTSVRGYHWEHNSGPTQRITASNVTAALLARELSFLIGSPVLDRTRLGGEYDFELEWRPDVLPRSGAIGSQLPIAIEEQLGLKLSGAVVSQQILVVDHMATASQEWGIESFRTVVK